MKQTPSILCLVLALVFCQVSSAQEDPGYVQQRENYKHKVISDSVFTPDNVIVLDPVAVIDIQFDSIEEYYEYRRTRYFINKLYPYYLKALEELETSEMELESIEKKRKKKKYVKSKQKVLKTQYKKKLLDLSVDEGRILIKMMERATDRSFYEIIKDYKSGFAAFKYNIVANLHGYSLRHGFDPEKDYLIEIVMSALEQ